MDQAEPAGEEPTQTQGAEVAAPESSPIEAGIPGGIVPRWKLVLL